ncbi:hypothetical protein B1L04_22220 [Microcystis aeruginosa KW]|uniref:Tryptophan halogenase n=1 Tax=Microcystis aeruginosa KW TaxID=1960155 RepID=A0A1V4BMA2_MICAE|nr:tryptophan 7-halogenase [Microcystis aeruginosa]OPF15250.1 hypothetical protein B1L04_22220 [Microcystis aeruginosa KW]
MIKSVKEIIVLGGGTAGWMTAAYISKAYGEKCKIRLIEAPNIPKIGVGEATIPNLQKVFFDFLGIKEQEWMPYCNASFKTAIKFIGWNGGDHSDYFYHMFGQVKEVHGIPLTHYWHYNKMADNNTEPMAYACYNKACLLDKNLSPIDLNNQQKISYAWHFDAHLLVKFLAKKSIEWGVTHIEGEFSHAEQDGEGYISSVTL